MVFFGTVGDTPEYNNEVIDQLYRETRGEPRCWGGPESEVTYLVGGSSRWVLLQFIDSRRDWLVERLKRIITGRRP